MTKKNKYKRNKGLDYFPSLYMILDDYPINKYDGFSMPSLQMNFNLGSFWSNPTLGLNLNTLSNILNNVPLLTPPLVSLLIPGTTGKKSLTGKINNMGEFGQMALMSGAGIAGNVLGNTLAGGKTSSTGNTIGTIGSALGGISGSVIGGPLGGMVGSFTGNLMGGVWNSMFGSKMNYENINKIENELNLGANYNSSANNFEELTLEIMSAPSLSYFTKSDIGFDGVFANAASRKFKELSARKKFVEDWIARTLENAASNLQLNQLNNLLRGWFAYGGLLDNNFGGGAIDYDLANQQLEINAMKAMSLNRQYSLPNMGLNTFAKGGKIHIKPENRGKFTALKKRTGKSATWFKKHGTPALRKMATFALNARKWKHAFGGDLLTNGTVFSNGVITISNGGTHEESPYEGVQVGVDPLGIPNLVEEGETIWNDYVFSNRIHVPNAVRNKYKLRGTKDMSFSDAAKKILKASEERPNDPISMETMNINLSRLALEQETIRELRNMNNKNKYDIGGILRGASALGPAIGLGYNLLTKPDYSYADLLEAAALRAATILPITSNPIDTMMTYRPFDLDYLATKAAAQAAATRRNIMNTSGGNRANAVGSLLAADYNALIALGETLRQGDEFNWNRLMQTQTFNRGTKQANAEMALKAAIANQEAGLKASQMGLSGTEKALAMKQDIDAKRGAAISANLTGLFDNLGNIGIDMLNRKDRNFYINTVVPNLPIEQYARVYGKSRAKQEAKRRGFTDTEITEIFKANGGKLNRRKRGGFTY